MFMRARNTLNSRPTARPGFLTRFSHEEDGAMLVFGVYTMLIIMIVAGIGIDVMHHERRNSLVQSTLDRAVLAAADLDQKLTPTEVVNDYFAKAGLSDALKSVTVDEGLSYRVVSATADAEINTQFMRMTGVETLNTLATSTAEERIDGVEISLVLDVSGSMNSNNRLTNVKAAARDFIDEMIDNTEEGKLSISIIPYATQVAMPANFINEFNISQEHSYSNCVNFQNTDFNDTGISTTDPLERTMHFDVWETRDGRSRDPIEFVRRPICERKASREMMIMQNDRVALKSFISNLYATGNTSIDIGMKWGTALLDPALQPVVDNLIASGDIDPVFSALPNAYDSGDSLKVIVLMTDGQNTSQYYVRDGYREGPSNIWWNEDEGKYSVYRESNGQYYWPHDNSWNDHAYGNGTYEEYTCSGPLYYGNCYSGWDSETIEEPGEALAPVEYPDLWAYTSLRWNVKKNYEPWTGSSQAWNDWYYAVRSSVGTSTKNARTQAICNAAKDQQVIVFAIGFEAPESGENVLKACASSDSHFFDVNGLEIVEAFSSIASSIRKLRLTQ